MAAPFSNRVKAGRQQARGVCLGWLLLLICGALFVPGCTAPPTAENEAADKSAEIAEQGRPTVYVQISVVGLPASEFDKLDFIADAWPLREVIIVEESAHERLLDYINRTAAASTLASPAVLMFAGQPVRIETTDEPPASVTTGMDSTTRYAIGLVAELPDGSGSVVSLDLEFAYHADEKMISAWTGENITLKPGQRAMIRLAADRAGLPTLLSIAAAADPAPQSREFGEADS